MISGKQIRAGRLLLNIDSDELARISKVGLATIKRFEAAPGIPPSRAGNLEKVKTALEARGVVFLGDPVNSPGVQLMKIK
ncbi:transcriptional regulator [Planktomarina temperata]|nr:transcriptional regulator [Planktomarina temperata]